MFGRIRRLNSDLEDCYALEEIDDKLLSFSVGQEDNEFDGSSNDENEVDSLSCNSYNEMQENQVDEKKTTSDLGINTRQHSDESFVSTDSKFLLRKWYEREELPITQSVYESLPVTFGTEPIDKFCRKMATSCKKSERQYVLSPEYFDENSDPFLNYLSSNNESNCEIETLALLEAQHKSIESESKRLLSANATIIIDHLYASQDLAGNIHHAQILVRNKILGIVDVRRRIRWHKVMNAAKAIILRDNLLSFDILLNQIQRCYDYEEEIRKRIQSREYSALVYIFLEFQKYLSQNKPAISINCLSDLRHRTHNLQDFVIIELCGKIIANIRDVKEYELALKACQQISPNHLIIGQSVQIGVSRLLLYHTSIVDEFMCGKLVATIHECIEVYKRIIEVSSVCEKIAEEIRRNFATFWNHCKAMLGAFIVPAKLLAALQEKLGESDLVAHIETDKIMKSNLIKYLDTMWQKFLTTFQHEEFSDNHIPEPLELIFENIESYRIYLQKFPELVIDQLTLFVDIYMLVIFKFCSGTTENEDILIGKLPVMSPLIPATAFRNFKNGISKKKSQQQQVHTLCDTKVITNICLDEGIDTDNVINCIDDARTRYQQKIITFPNIKIITNEYAAASSLAAPQDVLSGRWRAADSLSVLANFLSNLCASYNDNESSTRSPTITMMNPHIIRTLYFLCQQCERIASLRSIGPLGILSSILTTDWTTQVIHSRANTYVDDILTRIQNLMILNHDHGDDKLSCLVHIVYETLLEGYAHVPICSIQGRSFMTLDVMHFRERLQQLLPDKTTDDGMKIDQYIKAFYFSLSDRFVFVKEHVHMYKLRHAINLMKVQCSTSDGNTTTKDAEIRNWEIRVRELYRNKPVDHIIN